MRYATATAFRQALEQRLKNEADDTGLSLARLRKRVAFELFLRRLLVVAPDRWVLKGALALNFRLAIATRSTKDIDSTYVAARLRDRRSVQGPSETTRADEPDHAQAGQMRLKLVGPDGVTRSAPACAIAAAF